METDNIKQLGNICRTEKRDNPNAGRVYDSDGLSPTITNMQGGGRQPHILDIENLTRKEIDECILAEQSRAEQSRAEQSRAEQHSLCPASNERGENPSGDRWSSRSGLPFKQNTKRESDRKREYFTHSDDGEYP